ncbi:alanine racemase [Brevibacillus massiliensis]|uniref:alanine racemase n=1 Tax=Brevibacillus massiliensis TaxID=1118054 RepID=UPI000304CE0A|nr:alanine racemase [Brevibacillus massiliensis]
MNEKQSALMEQVDTPSLLLDLDIMEKNLQQIAAFANEQQICWRPHIKTHKCVEIAKRQIALGAVGVTVAKVSEAEVMARAGIGDILIAYPLFSPMKLKKTVALLPLAKVTIAVDHPRQAEWIQQFLAESSVVLDVWIKIDSGLRRCGVEPGRETVDLAKAVSKHPNLRLTGLFTHAGHSYAADSIAKIEEIGRLEGQAVAESADWCEREGILIKHRSAGSTPTFRYCGRVPGITEIRPGNAVFFDAVQVGLGTATFEQCALSVLGSVVSMHGNDRLVLDTGSKSLSLEQGAHGNATVKGFGHVVGHPEVFLSRLSEEHGIAEIHSATELTLGDRVQIIPNHACTVANLFDSYVLHRRGTVVGEWKVDARGKVQ